MNTIDINNYPELDNYTKQDIYLDCVGCGGLYLAVEMARKMNLKKGDLVLDLGSGFGNTSIFLAKMYGITVISVDLWFSQNEFKDRINNENLHGKIIPLRFDIGKEIIFPDEYFDAVFCMNSLFMFGGNEEFLSGLFKTLRPGGRICIGSECFNEEPNYKNLEDVPKVYNYSWDWNVWEDCCSKYHSPEWWKKLVSETGVIDIDFCGELKDGRLLWEDLACNYEDYISSKIVSMKAMIPKDKIIDSILYGNDNNPYLTIFILSGIKK